MGMLPGVDKSALKDADIDKKGMVRTEAIILSMTPSEREKPKLMNYSRKKRIAAGAGVSLTEVNKVIKQYEMMKDMTKKLTSMQKQAKKRKGFGGFGSFKGLGF